MRDWQRLVSNAAHAVDAIVSFLEHGEAVCLLVCAIDARMEKIVRFVFAHPHILLLGDDSKKYASVLHCAAAHGQIAVVQWVLRHRSMRLTRKRGSGIGGNGSLAASPISSVCPFVVRPTADLGSETAADILPRLRAMAWVNRNVPYVFPPEVMYEAARQGDRHVVQWLHTTSQYEPYKAMEFAASRGHLEIVQWLYDHEKSALQPGKNGAANAGANTKIYMLVPLHTAAEGDHNSADVMNWIAVFPKCKYFREAFAMRKGLFDSYDQRDDSIDWDQKSARDFKFSRKRYKAIDFAASAGNLDLIKRLHADKQWPCTSQAMDGAARMGHLDVVQWLHKNRTEGCTSNAISAAAGNGHFKLAQWLHEHRFEGCRSYAMDLAASHGHLQILQWLYQEYPRFSCTQPFLPCVAANNHQHVLRWLHEEKGFEYDLRTVEAAIANGHFALTQWLLEQEPDLKAQLTASVVAKAAKSGNTAMTQWLVEDLGLWSSQALASAAVARNFELVKWLHSCGSSDRVGPAELFALARRYDFEVLEWLLKHKLGQPKFAPSEKDFDALFASLKEAAGEKTINQPATKRLLAWDLHTKECPSWLSKYARLVLKYCPEFLLNVDSTPLLSAQRGESRILQCLASAGHPEVYTKQTFRALLTFTKAGDIVQWFFTTSSTEYLDASVVEWAAKFQLVGLLEFLLVVKMEGMDERYRVHACETVMHTACRHGHLELLRWSSTKLESLSSSSNAVNPATDGEGTTTTKDVKNKLSAPLWRELSVEAAANGHTEILQWIVNERGPNILLNHQVYLQKLVDAAAENGHVHVLKWIDSVFKDASILISSAGREAAIANKNFDVIQWLVEQHQELVAHLDQASQDEIAMCLDEGMDGFVPAGIPYVLHSSSSHDLARWRFHPSTLR